jgi:hypothetical protein
MGIRRSFFINYKWQSRTEVQILSRNKKSLIYSFFFCDMCCFL